MARAFTGAVRDKTGTLASGRTVQVIRDVDNVCVSSTTTDALGEFGSANIITENGTVTTASASVITDSGQTWTVDEFAGHYGVLITSGTQEGKWRKIASNTATALTLDSALPGTTSVDDTFEVAALHTLVFNGEADRNALVYAGVMPTGEPWTPAEITTALWLDAADSDTITLNGSNVSQWDDKSGNDRHATQGTAAAQPEYLSEAQNGLNILRFNGSSHYLRNVTAELLQNNASEFTVFFVLKATGSDSRFAFLYGDDSRRQIVFQRFNGLDLFYATAGTDAFARLSQNLNWQIASWRYDGSGSTNSERLQVFRNGAQMSPTFVETIPSNLGTLTHGFFVGARSNLTSLMVMDFSEAIIIPSTINDETQERINGYLAWKWGLEANLPSGHPYKDAAP